MLYNEFESYIFKITATFLGVNELNSQYYTECKHDAMEDGKAICTWGKWILINQFNMKLWISSK